MLDILQIICFNEIESNNERMIFGYEKTYGIYFAANNGDFDFSRQYVNSLCGR